ncbi:histidine phosphatase family protein [Paenibacillus cisolokensis]|uniref:histidine phosphatase family protein n=1 Tax=Paenibacillus TaxID=44249 RepID=UPI000721CA63|nr:histidine phosphatase family protein [Paenibacillus sp. 32O-W]ALS27783.1 phosphoglycerate kinase [Paenibacillus sp. 32O-W]
MFIGLVRHGQTDWNALGKIQGQTDIPLNAAGVAQARALAERLAQDEWKWEAVVASTLQRAAETARIIAQRLRLPAPASDPRLNERRFGDAEGTTEAERLARWGADWRSADLGQESDGEVRERASAFLADWRRRMPDGKLLVVTHGSFLAQMMAVMNGDLEIRHIGNMSYSILEYQDGKWHSHLHNCTRHLES